MCLILADMQYLCCISRVLFVLYWYPGSCQRPVKAILTPAYPTTTAYRKRKRNRTSNEWSLLHYHFPASGSRWAASLQGEETKEVDNIHPLHLPMGMREREHLWGAQWGLIFLFPVCLNPPTFTFHMWWNHLWSRITTRLSFCHLRVVRLVENRTSKPTEHKILRVTNVKWKQEQALCETCLPRGLLKYPTQVWKRLCKASKQKSYSYTWR